MSKSKEWLKSLNLSDPATTDALEDAFDLLEVVDVYEDTALSLVSSITQAILADCELKPAFDLQQRLDGAEAALEFIKKRQDEFYEELTPQYDSIVRGLVTEALKEIKP